MLHIHVQSNRKRNVSPKRALFKPKYRSEYTEADFEAEDRAWQRINEWSNEQLKKIELEDAQRAAEEEKEPWPPVWKPIEESVQFKSGLIEDFVKRHAIEDMDESEFNSLPDREDYGDDPGVLNKLKRFFKLVRDTRGYDVDWYPPPFFCSPFRPMNDVHRVMNADRLFKNSVNRMLECVVDKINARAKNHGEEYKLLKVEKFVGALKFRMNLITFSVELVSSSSSDGDGGVEKHVQALVRGRGGGKHICLEWRFKPVEPPTEDGQTEDGQTEDVPTEDVPSPKRKRKLLSRSAEFIRRFSRLSNPDVIAIAADLEQPKKKKKSKRETKGSLVENHTGHSISWSII